MKRHTAEFWLFFITVLWGGTFVLVKEAVHVVDPSTFVALRFGVASILSMLLWPSAVRAIDGTTLKRGIVLGLLYGSGFMLQTFGLAETSASESAFITGTMVGFVPIVQFLMFRSKIEVTHIVSVFTIIAGLYLFTAPELHGVQMGDVLTLISAIVWAVYMVLIDHWSTDMRSEPVKQNSLVILQFVVTLALALIGSAIYMAPDSVDLHIAWGKPLIVAIIYCSVFASIIPTFVQTRFQQYTHPVRAGVIYALEPLAASVIAWLLTQETFTARQMIGGGVLVSAVIVPDVWSMWRKK